MQKLRTRVTNAGKISQLVSSRVEFGFSSSHEKPHTLYQDGMQKREMVYV